MSKLVVWYVPKKNSYYYKIVDGGYRKYYVGLKNSYDHEVIIVVDGIYLSQYKVSKFTRLKYRLKRKLISFLEKL